MQLVDGSHGAGLNALSRTLFLALHRRDRAIEDVRVLAPPAPRSEDIARVRARKSQEEDEVVTFDTVMPNTTAQFDDELQTIAGTLTDATDLTAGGRRLLNRAADQMTATKARVNPVAADAARGLTSTAAGLFRPPHPHSRTSGRRNAPAAARRRGRNAARAPRTGARAASGGCGQGEGVDRPPVSRWEKTRGTGLGASTASLRRRSWRARLTRRLRASVRAATPMKRMEGSRGVVSLHGHKDLRRRLVRQQRRANGRKVGTIGPRDPTLVEHRRERRDPHRAPYQGPARGRRAPAGEAWRWREARRSRVRSLACRVGRRTSCRRLLPSSKQRSRPARLLLVAVVGVASGRAVATTAAL